MARFDAVVFDLGGVLVDWDPRYLYRKLFAGREAEMEQFLASVCTTEWNSQQDAGRSWIDAVALLQQEHPGHAEMIQAYHQRWDEMQAGPISGTVEILGELRDRGWPLFALTNWSRELFPIARERYDFLGWFRGIIVSGEEKLIKPDPRIFALLAERFGIVAAKTVYIDDNADNVAAAGKFGLHAIRFTDPSALRTELEALAIL